MGTLMMCCLKYHAAHISSFGVKAPLQYPHCIQFIVCHLAFFDGVQLYAKIFKRWESTIDDQIVNYIAHT